eukprot:scaffold41656_cov52-Attheya_sp.AAC.1
MICWVEEQCVKFLRRSQEATLRVEHHQTTEFFPCWYQLVVYAVERHEWASKRRVLSRICTRHCLTGCVYDAVFNTADVSPSVLLGGRMKYAFYGAAPEWKANGRRLKDIPHKEVIHHMVGETILQLTPGNDNIVVPLVFAISPLEVNLVHCSNSPQGFQGGRG